MRDSKQNIIITGASRGIGASIALQYSNSNTRIFIIGRSYDKLQQVELSCNKQGAEVISICMDVCDKKLMHDTLKRICKKYKIDVIVCCAGVSAGTLNATECIDNIEKILNTNVLGTIYTIVPIIPFMIKNKSGSIAIVSSMASMIGLSSAPTYCASKAAIKVFGDAMRVYLKPYGIDLSMIIPGYVDTQMTQKNNFPMPFKISAEKAAKIIIKGIKQKKRVIAFPIYMYIALKIINIFPIALLDYIISKLPGKSSLKL